MRGAIFTLTFSPAIHRRIFCATSVAPLVGWSLQLARSDLWSNHAAMVLESVIYDYVVCIRKVMDYGPVMDLDSCNHTSR